MNIRPIALCMCCALGLVAALTGGHSYASESESDSPNSPLLTEPLSAFDDCGKCVQTCSPGEHKFAAHLDGIDRAYEEGTHDCEPTWCSISHPESSSCGAAVSVETARIWDLLAEDSRPRDLRKVIDGIDRAFYVRSREAIQLQGCTGDIILSLPLAPEQISMLAGE